LKGLASDLSPETVIHHYQTIRKTFIFLIDGPRVPSGIVRTRVLRLGAIGQDDTRKYREKYQYDLIHPHASSLPG
jgi:hypothetical protein